MDSDSDESEYEPMDEDVIDSDDVLPSCEHESILLLPIRDVAIPPDFCIDPCTVSVVELEEIIDDFLRRDVLKEELTNVNTNASSYALPKFSKNEIQLGKKGNHFQRPPRVISKTYGTLLHYACRDRNGYRGEQKIRLLLDSAAKADISPKEMFTLAEVTVTFTRGEWTPSDKESSGVWKTRCTPFFILLDNRNATASSIRMLAATWPQIVNLKRFGAVEFPSADIVSWNGREGTTHQSNDTCIINTLFHVLLEMSPESNKRIHSTVAILLEFADEATTKGAESLVSANVSIDANCPLGNLCSGDHASNVEKACNGIHLALSSASLHPKLISLLISAWPNALTQCGHGFRVGCPFPLHSVLQRRPRNLLEAQSKIETIQVLLLESTLEAAAASLLRTCEEGRLAFHEVFRLLSKGSSENEKQIADRLRIILDTLLHRKDRRGRTILHHIVSSGCQLDCSEMLNRRLGGRSSLLRLADADKVWSNQTNSQQYLTEEIRLLYERNAGYHVEVVRWVLDKKPLLAFMYDEDGHNPFHRAIVLGKDWGSGLCDLVRINPDWAYRPTRNGLAPFQLAATVVKGPNCQIETSFQLLNYTGAVLCSTRKQELTIKKT
eukprot:scaffold24507_cov122-Cylindrotheca_fusiformis.AAC.2